MKEASLQIREGRPHTANHSPPRRSCLSSLGSCLDVLTYNVKMIKCDPRDQGCTATGNPKNDHAEARAKEMIDWIARPDQQSGSRIRGALTGPVDVVVINEMVRQKPRNTLIRGPKPGPFKKRRGGLANKYGYKHTEKNRPSNPNITGTDGGIMILSQYPIQADHYKAFPKSAMKDKSLGHGVVHAEISKHGQTYHVFATHFDTNAGPTNCPAQSSGWTSFQKEEVNIMDSFVENHAGNEPAIMAGDFNFGVGLQQCAEENRRFFSSALDTLDAVEPTHPNDTEGGKDFSSSASDPGRVLDHIMVRNMPLSNHSYAERLRFQASNSTIGVEGDNLSDHHPVYAFLQQCNRPRITSAQTKVSDRQTKPSQQQGGYPISPEFQVTLSQVPSCPDPGLEIHWEVATDDSFEHVVYEAHDTVDRNRQQPSISTTASLQPNTQYYWRAYLGPENHWPPAKNQKDGIWTPSNTPQVSSEIQSFRTFDPGADRFEDNDRPSSATQLSQSEWTHTHMACPEGGILPTKSTGQCDGIFTTTQHTGSNAPFVAYERWTLTKSNLTLDEGDVDYFEVELPPLDLEMTNQRADQKLEKNLCATLTVRSQNGTPSSRKIRSDPQFSTNVWPENNAQGKYELNDPYSTSTNDPALTCTSWDSQSTQIIRIGAEDGERWGGYELQLDIHLKLTHEQYERAVAAKVAGWREAQRMADLQFIDPLRNLDCSGATCHMNFPTLDGWDLGDEPFPDRPICRVCHQAMPFRVGSPGPFELIMGAASDLNVRLLSTGGTVVAEAGRVAAPTQPLSAEVPTHRQADTRRPIQASPRIEAWKRLSVDRLEPGTYLLVLRGAPSILTFDTLTLPPQEQPVESPPQGTDPSQRVDQPDHIQVTALAKAGAFLSGVSTFEGVSEATVSTLGGAQSVFTWGGSLALGARNGPVNVRITSLRTTGSLVSTTEGFEASPTPTRETMTLLTGDVVVRPVPRIGVQPYVIGGLGARRLSFRDHGEALEAPQWTTAAQIGVGLDLRLGNMTLGVEVVDYLTGLTGESDDGLRHDAFAFLTLGVPLF